MIDIPELIRNGKDWAVIAYYKIPTTNVNEELSVYRSALHYACDRGRIDLVRKLIELGADVNLEVREGRPINEACSNAHPEVVKILLQHGAILDVSTPRLNPIFDCITCGYRLNALWLRNDNRNLEEVESSLLKCVRILIDGGLDLVAAYNSQAMVDMDAAAFARMYGHIEMTEMIIDHLYGHNERFKAAAWAETEVVALGNAVSRQKFRRTRYPPTRGKNKNWRPDPGEYWIDPTKD